METCKFCQENAADKKNTHYLTDAVIRTCLNEGGSNTREKGAMFNISTTKDDVEFRFQRSTSKEAIIEALGREPHQAEIDKAMLIPFSVDYVFCSECEARFTVIEKSFLEKIIPELRGKDFTGINEVSFKEVKEIRLFFLLQVWRMGVCDPTLEVSEHFLERLRPILFDPENNLDALKAMPLNVTYLSTIGDEFEYTTNKVGVIEDQQAIGIAMNDFIIQFSIDNHNIPFASLFGINEQKNIDYFTNVNEEQFLFKVFDNEGRKVINAKMIQLKVRQMMARYQRDFIKEFYKRKGKDPHPFLIRQFINELLNGDKFNDSPRYSDEHYHKVLAYFMAK